MLKEPNLEILAMSQFQQLCKEQIQVLLNIYEYEILLTSL
jgi:hypothetical protein